MVVVGHLLIAGATMAKIMALDDAGVLEQLDGPVDGRNRDVLVDGGAAPVQLFDVGMILRCRQHPRDHAALLGHAHALGRAKRFDVYRF